MKIFSMNDCDWMAGEDLESCKAAYVKITGMDANDEETFSDTYELSPEKMDKLKFNDVEAGVTRTFREQLERMIAAGEKFPTFFASTEY